MKNSIDQFICDHLNQKVYKQEVFLGTGTFGKFYNVTEVSSGRCYTAKIIPKIPTSYDNWEDKILSEITIHKSLIHKCIVKLHSYFHDVKNIYVLSEPSSKITMLGLIKKRNILSDPEVRYYMKRVLLALEYIHKKNIIHCDLKLGNLLITKSMEIKVGDFGYATPTDYPKKEQNKLFCSRSYVAPEILVGEVYGQEVDIWAFGCILYRLLVGLMPFSSLNVQDIYNRIQTCMCNVPQHVNLCAANMLYRIFTRIPKKRPNASALLIDQYFHIGFTPLTLPQSALETCPFPTKFQHSDKNSGIPSLMGMCLSSSKQCGLPLNKISQEQLIHLKTLLLATLSFDMEEKPYKDECNEVSVSQLPRWICSWIDLSDDYGFGYRLNDGSTGIIFIDGSKLLFCPDNNIMYIDEEGKKTFCKRSAYSKVLERKVKLYETFSSYLFKHKEDSETSPNKEEKSECSEIAYVTNWICFQHKVAILFSTGLLQISYLFDKLSVILSPSNETITFIYHEGVTQTYKLDLIEKNGCTKELERKLWNIWKDIHKMIQKKSYLTICIN